MYLTGEEYFKLQGIKGRRKGFSTTSYNQFIYTLINYSRKQYKLKRIKNHLRVTFIGYIYKIPK